MGWLRDLITNSEVPISSFGRLAQLALDSPDWPDDCRIKARSLSTLFSKLDRGQDLDWLRDRPLAQRALAQLMGRPWADVQAHLGESELRGDGRMLRLRDVRFARELDLCREDLPPGIPADVLQPPLWRPSWWLAPSGSGRSLAGAWLEARGLARHVLIEQPSDWRNIPPRGALFVELGADVTVGERELELLRCQQRPLCVASARPLSPASSADHPTFITIVSPSIADTLPELVDWVSSRLNGDGHFDVERAEQWFKRVVLPVRAVNTLGDALGLLGLLDETAPRNLHGKSLDEVIEGYLLRRLKQAHDDATGGPAASGSAFSLLRELGARCLVQGTAGLGAARALDEWTALFAGEKADEAPDPSWFDAALGHESGELGLSRKALRRLAHKLPPAAYQLTRALERAQILRPAFRQRTLANPTEPSSVERAEAYVLGPHFLTSLLEARATQEALQLSPLDWGQALLTGADPEGLVSALLERIRRDDFVPVQRLLDTFEDDLAALVAAVEAATIALGLASLEGKRLPDELVTDLLHEAVRSVVPFVDGLETRFVPQATQAAVYGRDSWQLAWLCLTENARSLPTVLHPLRAGPGVVRDVRAAVLRAAHEAPLARACAIACLLDRNITEGDPAERAPVSAALDQLLQLSVDATPEERTSLRRVCEALLPFSGLTALFAVANARQLGKAELSAKLWETCRELPEPWPHESEEVRTEFWRTASGELLEARLERGLDVAWRWLLPHQLSAWLRSRKQPIPEGAVEHLPLDAALGVFDEHGPAAFTLAALSLLMERAPLRIASELNRLLGAPAAVDLQLVLFAARQAAGAALLEALPSAAALLQLSPERLDAVRRFLLRRTRERGLATEPAARLLAELESRLLPLRLAVRA